MNVFIVFNADQLFLKEINPTPSINLLASIFLISTALISVFVFLFLFPGVYVLSIHSKILLYIALSKYILPLTDFRQVRL